MTFLIPTTYRQGDIYYLCGFFSFYFVFVFVCMCATAANRMPTSYTAVVYERVWVFVLNANNIFGSVVVGQRSDMCVPDGAFDGCSIGACIEENVGKMADCNFWFIGF